MSAGRVRVSFVTAVRTAADLLTGDLVTAIVKGITGASTANRVSVSIMGIPLLDFSELKAKRSFDERVKRLDDAREALVESIAAIDQLSSDAQAVKLDHSRMVGELKTVTESKASAEKKLEEITRITNRDVSAFQTLAGVTNVRRERWIGFGSGVLASAFVTVGWYILQRLGYV